MAIAYGTVATREPSRKASRPSGRVSSYRKGANGQAVELVSIGGRTVEVDAEIAPIVVALNAAGVPTEASCSGHGFRPGNIALGDGREIIIARDYAEARKIGRMFPHDINGQRISRTWAMFALAIASPFLAAMISGAAQ